MSAAAYLGCVALITALGVLLAMQLRPPFGHAVRQWIGLEKEPHAAPDSFYAVRVAPLLDSRCAGCHGAGKQKAQQRLDSFAALMRGGRHGAVIQPGRVRDSELYTRISLPSADDKAMPPSGKTPLTADEVTVIRLWIAAGASGTQRVVVGAPKPVVEITPPEIDPRAVARQRAPLAAAVAALQRRFPGLIDYDSRSSADLDVNAALMGAAFGDSELAALAPVKARMVWADFSRTAITDASAPGLAAMTSLRTLHLRNTKLTDSATLALRRRGVAVYGGSDE